MTIIDKIKVAHDPMRAFGQGYTLGKVEVYCEQVQAGAKLNASCLVNKRDIDIARRLIADAGLKAIIDEDHSEDFADVDIYKYEFVRALLDGLNERGAPRSAFDNWVNGKLFGYSDYEIARWLHEHGYISTYP